MDIGVPFRDLGEFDVAPLLERVEQLSESDWLDNSYRQQTYDVHQQTQSVVLVFTDGSGWPELEVRKEPGWDLLADVAFPLVQQVLADHYPPGGTVIRAMAAKLLPGGIIKPHKDKHPSFHYGHRVHVPLISNPRVRFMIDGQPHKFKVGRVYEINNQMQHSVMNKGSQGRVNFIFDYVPPSHLGQTSIAPAEVG